MKVPSFVTTLGMLLILHGAISIITRGTPDGSITDNFRFYGKDNIGDLIPAALVITIVVSIFAILLMQYTTFGRKIYSVGGNKMTSYLSGVKVEWIKTGAFMICAMFGAIGAVLIAGFSGVSTLSVGEGYEFSSISAAVLSGVSLTGGRGNVGHALTGALTLQAIFVLLNFLSLPIPIRFAVEGLIIIAAMAFTAWRDKHG
jgi:ribose transport system permease protein